MCGSKYVTAWEMCGSKYVTAWKRCGTKYGCMRNEHSNRMVGSKDNPENTTTKNLPPNFRWLKLLVRPIYSSHLKEIVFYMSGGGGLVFLGP